MNSFSWFFAGFCSCAFLAALIVIFDALRSRWTADRRFALYRILLFRELCSWLYGDKSSDVELFLQNLDVNYQRLLEFAAIRKCLFISAESLVDEFKKHIHDSSCKRCGVEIEEGNLCSYCIHEVFE